MRKINTKKHYITKINMESYTFSGNSDRRYRIVNGQKFQVNKKKVTSFSSNWCTDPTYVILL
jgi:hypothetical protein